MKRVGSVLFLACLPAFLLLVSPAFAQGVFHYLAPDDEVILYDPADGVGSATIEISILENAANPGFPSDTEAFSLGLAQDGPLIVIDVEITPVLEALNGGFGPDFFSENIDPFNGPGFYVGIVYSFVGPDFIQFIDPTPVLEVSYETDADELIGVFDGATVDLIFTETLGSPPVENVVVVAGQSESVDPVNGLVTLEAINDEFIRGDANGDGAVTGLVDGFFVLLYQFVPGSPEPPCFDAADADDSGSLNGLADGVFLLNYQFVPTSPPPAAPGPLFCGNDPTDDPLSCDLFPACL